MKQRTHAAVLVLTGRGAEADVVRGLEMGADDYLVKPFAQRELISRIRALLRRREMARDQESGRTIELGQLLIDLDEHRVWVRGREVHLTPTEFSLLRELASPPGRVHTHASLLRRVWGEAYRQEHHYVKSYVGRLRRKLGPAGLPRLIETAWGAGYRLVPPEEQP